MSKVEVKCHQNLITSVSTTMHIPSMMINFSSRVPTLLVRKNSWTS